MLQDFPDRKRKCSLLLPISSRPAHRGQSAKRLQKNALVQAGIAIPIFAMTMAGKNLIMEKIRLSPEPVLVKPTKLPALGDQQPDPLV